MAEALLTHELVGAHLDNTIDADCQANLSSNPGLRQYCQRLDEYLKRNWEYMLHMIGRKADTDAYWHQVELMLYQLNGLDDAFTAITVELRTKQRKKQVDKLVFTPRIKANPKRYSQLL